MSKYEISIEDGVVVVCAIGEGYVRAFYFAGGDDPEGTSQELYDLLKSARADVEQVKEV